MKTIPALIVAAVVLAGCATPVTQRSKADKAALAQEVQKEQVIALRSSWNELFRLSRVAFPLLTSAVPFCKHRLRWRLGIFIANADTFGKLGTAAKTAFGVTDRIKVLYVIPGSPGDTAGLKKGDFLVSVNGWPVPTGKGAPKETLEKVNSADRNGASFEMTLRRGGALRTVTIKPAQQCAFNVQLAGGDSVNAYADGKSVHVFQGMMRFAENDDELSLVVAHEIAHDAMNHIEKKKQNSELGSLFDIMAAAVGVNTNGSFARAGGRAYSQDFEAEADYVGLYIMARAGLPIADAPQFWRRMAAAHPETIKGSFNATHPATPERFLAMEKTIKEITLKKKEDLPLLPNMKKPDGGS